MSSRFILVIAFVLVLVVGALDIGLHGHFDDDVYRRQVERILEKAGYSSSGAKPIRVSVTDRWVVLEGIVPTQAHREEASDLVMGQVPGLRGLTNDLKTEETLCAREVLEGLKALVATDQASGAQLSYLADEACNVTLTGCVPTQAIREKVERIASQAPGVQKVTSNLEVGDCLREIEEILKGISNINFDHNKWTIRPESLPSVDKVAEVLNRERFRKVRVRIEGHTDSVDTEEYNQWLSEQRVNSVRDALIQRGVDADRLEAVGFGEGRPVASNETPEGRAENRRIEFKVIQQNPEKK